MATSRIAWDSGHQPVDGIGGDASGIAAADETVDVNGRTVHGSSGLGAQGVGSIDHGGSYWQMHPMEADPMMNQSSSSVMCQTHFLETSATQTDGSDRPAHEETTAAAAAAAAVGSRALPWVGNVAPSSEFMTGGQHGVSTGSLASSTLIHGIRSALDPQVHREEAAVELASRTAFPTSPTPRAYYTRPTSPTPRALYSTE